MTAMTITKALATAKSLEAKIERELPRLKFLAHVEGTGNFATVVGTSSSVAEVEKGIISALQSVEDMIAQRAAIKAAVVASNAITTVMIGDKAYTVAAAIEMKRSIAHRKQLLAQLQRAKVVGDSEATKRSDNFNAKIEQMRSNAFTGKDRKLTDADLDILTDPVKTQTAPSLLDPIGIAGKIEDLVKEIEDFELNVDYALSESNAKTTVEVA